MRAEPTFATQRSPDRYTDGPAVGKAIERWQGRRPTRWQQYQLDVALEHVDGPASPYAYDEIIAIVGRRCGKTVTAFGVPLVRALAGPVQLPNGRRLPFRGVHVAQNISAAQQRFGEDLVGPYRRRFSDDAWRSAVRFLQSNGSTRLVVDPRKTKLIDDAEKNGIASEIRVLAPTGNAARGAGVFHRTYDEELTYLLERGQELAEAGRPTMAELQGFGQTWHVSNIKKDTDQRHYLWHQREKGRAAVRADRRDGICYLEYSLPPGVDPNDEREWWRYYPALGDGIVGIQQLRRDREEFETMNRDGGAAFFAEYLGRWADENETGVAGWKAIQQSDFVAALTDLEQPEDADAVIGVDVDPFFRSATITAAVQAGDVLLLEVIDHRPGIEWVRDAVLELADGVVAIGVDAYGPGLSLLEELQRLPLIAEKLVVTKGQELYAACYGFEARLRDRTVKIRKSDYHERLTVAAAAAERTPGRQWQWERRVNPSQTPLMSATVAVWAYEHRPAPVPDSQIF